MLPDLPPDDLAYVEHVLDIITSDRVNGIRNDPTIEPRSYLWALEQDLRVLTEILVEGKPSPWSKPAGPRPMEGAP